MMNTFELAKSHFIEGIECMARQEWADAEQAFRASLALAPQRVSTLTNLAAALVRQRRSAQALEVASEALALDPATVEAWLNQGLALAQQEQYALAVDSFDHAIRLNERSADAWANRASALHESDCHAEAIASAQRAVDVDPSHHVGWTNLAVAHEAMNNDAAALGAFRQAVQLAPDYAEAHWGLSQLLFKLGRLQECWESFDYRWALSNSSNRPLETGHPLWRGDRSNRPLLLWGEQGIGDQILYASILSELREFPQKKYLAVDKRLVPLFSRSMPDFGVIDIARVDEYSAIEEQLPLGSLPRFFRRDLASFAAAPSPYLQADPARTATLRQRIGRPGKLVCGLSWSSTRKGLGRPKSVGLTEMATSLACDHRHFVSLQYGDTAAERTALLNDKGIEVQGVDEVDNFNDLDGLAALIQACDVVITTSNTTAHLAGALGKETLLLLPLGKGRLWYWVEQDGRNPWYPSIRMFSQSALGDWQRPLDEVGRHLRKTT